MRWHHNFMLILVIPVSVTITSCKGFNQTMHMQELDNGKYKVTDVIRENRERRTNRYLVELENGDSTRFWGRTSRVSVNRVKPSNNRNSLINYLRVNKDKSNYSLYLHENFQIDRRWEDHDRSHNNRHDDDLLDSSDNDSNRHHRNDSNRRKSSPSKQRSRNSSDSSSSSNNRNSSSSGRRRH